MYKRIRLKKIESIKDTLDRIVDKKIVKVDYDLTSSWDGDGAEADAIAIYLEDGSVLKLSAAYSAIVTDYEEPQ